jgi:hypothetical protein
MTRRFPYVLFLAAAAVLLLAPGAARGDPPQPEPLDRTGDIGGAPFRIIVPATWNGKLIVFADGHRDKADHPGELDDRTPFVAPGPLSRATLLGEGWALAGTAYRSNGYSVKEALHDLLALANYFRDNVADPTRTLLWGLSMGSIPTLKLAERNGGTFDGYLASCSVAAGAPRQADQFAVERLAYDVTFGLPATWGTVGDVRDDLDFESEVLPVLFGQVFDPLNGQLNFARFEFIRLVAGIPGSGLTPPTGFYPGWLTNFYFASEGMGEIERRAGGPVLQNLDHTYTLTAAEKDYLVGLGIDADPLLQGMNTRRIVSAPPASRNYLEHYAQYTGQIKKPVLTLHTVTDDLLPVANVSAYRQTVETAGNANLLAQAYTDGVGHCSFPAAQSVAAVHALDAWVDTGIAPTDASFPTALGFVHGFVPPAWPQP